MITADKVKNQIQTLIETANEKTGNNDADLTSAVGSLVDGFGGAEDLDLVLTQQESLITELKSVLQEKASGGDNFLPDGYSRVGCLRFTGEQIADTGIICNQDTKIKVVFTRDSSDSMYMYGVLSDGNTATVTAYLASGGAWHFGNGSMSRTISANKDVIHTAIVQKSGIESASGTNAYNSVKDFETVGTLMLGTTRNANGTVGAAQFIGKILLFEVWQGENQVLRFIPVIKDGIYGFWDEIGQLFAPSITDTPFEGGDI